MSDIAKNPTFNPMGDAWAKKLLGIAGTGTFVVAVIISRRLSGNSELLSYHIGQYIGFVVGTLVLCVLGSLFVQKFRPYVLPVALVVSAVATLGAVSGFGRGGENGNQYLSNSYVIDWMSRSRTLCINRNDANTACEMVVKVVTVTDKSVDFLGFMADTSVGLKVTMGMRNSVGNNGLCWEVPKLEDLQVNFYASSNLIGNIEPGDQMLPISQAERQQYLPGLLAGQGLQPGDVMCSRFVVHDKEGNNVRAIREIVLLNGSPMKGESDSVYTFYPTDTRLNMISLG